MTDIGPGVLRVPLRTPTGTGAVAPTVGIDDQANAVVGSTVATAAQDIAARGFNPDGTGAGRLPGQVLGQTTTGRQEQLALTSSAWGGISVCYTDDNDGNSFDQVVLGVGGPIRTGDPIPGAGRRSRPAAVRCGSAGDRPGTVPSAGR